MFTENLLSVVKRLGFVITMKRGRNQYAEHAERLWQQSKSKVIPEEYRKYTLMEPNRRHTGHTTDYIL